MSRKTLPIPGNSRSISNQRYILAEEGCSNFRIMPEYQYDPKGILRNFTLKDLANAEKAAQLVTSDARLQEFAAAFTDPKFSQDPAFITGCGAYKLQSWTKDQELVLSQKR
jgi:ABC-type transport system substrate-binding protein